MVLVDVHRHSPGDIAGSALAMLPFCVVLGVFAVARWRPRSIAVRIIAVLQGLLAASSVNGVVNAIRDGPNPSMWFFVLLLPLATAAAINLWAEGNNR